MRLYGIDYGTTPPRPVLWLHAEIDQARRWLQEGPKRRLVEVPGKPRHLDPVTRAERYGRVLGASPKRVGTPLTSGAASRQCRRVNLPRPSSV